MGQNTSAVLAFLDNFLKNVGIIHSSVSKPALLSQIAIHAVKRQAGIHLF